VLIQWTGTVTPPPHRPSVLCTCVCVSSSAQKEQAGAERWHTFGARVRDCRHEGRPFTAGFVRLVEARLPVPNTLDEWPGRE